MLIRIKTHENTLVIAVLSAWSHVHTVYVQNIGPIILVIEIFARSESREPLMKIMNSVEI